MVLTRDASREGEKGMGLESGYSPAWVADSTGGTGLAGGVQGLPPQPCSPRAQQGHVLKDGSQNQLLLAASRLGLMQGL